MNRNALTPAEQRVLVELAIAPDTHAEIAERLNISKNTVNTHLASMFQKTGATSATQLVLWGFREALRMARPIALKVTWPTICPCGKAKAYRAGLCIGCYSIDTALRVIRAQEGD